MCYPSNVSFVSQDHFFIVVLYNLLLWNENVFTKKCGSLGSNYCFDTYLIPLPGNIFMFDSSNLIFWIIILSTVAEINRMNKLCCNHLKLIPRWYKISYWDSMMEKELYLWQLWYEFYIQINSLNLFALTVFFSYG